MNTNTLTIGSIVHFTYNGKGRTLKIEIVKDGPSGKVLTGQSFTDGKADGYRSYTVNKMILDDVGMVADYTMPNLGLIGPPNWRGR